MYDVQDHIKKLLVMLTKNQERKIKTDNKIQQQEIK